MCEVEKEGETQSLEAKARTNLQYQRKQEILAKITAKLTGEGYGGCGRDAVQETAHKSTVSTEEGRRCFRVIDEI